MERKQTYQYVRNAKGALVRGPKIIVSNDVKPSTIGGIITRAFAKNGIDIKNILKPSFGGKVIARGPVVHKSPCKNLTK